jgi:hypothetical protein
MEGIMVETPDANSPNIDSPRGTSRYRTAFRLAGGVLTAVCLGAVIGGATIAFGVWIGRHIGDKVDLARLDVTSDVIIVAMVAAFAFATWSRQLPRVLFLAVFAVGYTIIGVTTFHPSSEKLRFNDLVAEYIVHWAIVGAVAIPVAWLIGKLAVWKRKIARP